jgi:uncharacterized protein with gpF-like domain
MSQAVPSPASTSALTSAPSASASALAQQQQQEVLPSASVLLQAAKLAMAQDKPIQLDYYADTVTGKAFMGEDSETKDKMLVKSAEEFTSLIQKVYKVSDDYIIMTENSIYIASGKIQKRRIQANSLRGD